MNKMCPLLFLITCRSHKPFDQGDSAGVVSILMLKFSHKSIKCLETNSPPFSEKIYAGQPKRLIQFFKKWFAIIDEDLVFIITEFL